MMAPANRTTITITNIATSHHSHGHGDHAYDAHGNEAAIVASDPHRLEHWHFDRPFEGVAIAPVRNLATDFDTIVVAVANHDLNYLPLAARPPPALIQISEIVPFEISRL